MKKSISRKNRENTAFLYERISRDDNLEGDSYSVANQKKLLIKVAKEKGFTNLVHFFDDGISGVTMERPGLKEMLSALEQGRAAVVIVKDMSTILATPTSLNISTFLKIPLKSTSLESYLSDTAHVRPVM